MADKYEILDQLMRGPVRCDQCGTSFWYPYRVCHRWERRDGGPIVPKGKFVDCPTCQEQVATVQ